MNANDIANLRLEMGEHLGNINVPLPSVHAIRHPFLVFLVGYMSPWNIGPGRDANMLLTNNPMRFMNEAGRLNEVGLEGHTSKPSPFLRRDVLIPAVKKGDRRTILLSCHQAYWKAGPYPDFFRRVGGLLDIAPSVNEPNMLGFLLHHNLLDAAAGVAFMLPGLVANRTDYWIQRFLDADADSSEIDAFIGGLQVYWEQNLPR